jgi:hypothetical protein
VSKGSSAPAPHGSTGDFLSDFRHAVEEVLHLPGRPRSRWHRAGMSRRTERVLDFVGGLVLLVFAGGWLWTILSARGNDAYGAGLTPATSHISAALTEPDAPSTAFLTNAAIEAFATARGASGKLRVAIQSDSSAPVDSLPSGARVVYSAGGSIDTTAAPRGAGVWKVALAIGNALKPVTDFRLVTLRPSSDRARGRIGLYYVGNWPSERSAPAKAPPGKYAPPSGFIEVTPANAGTFVSDHFRLRDFLTHDQANVWPKYLVLRLELVDKLELVLADLEQRGVDVGGVRVMSGFRTPQYNVGGGNTAGRADLSRHMYGDAADIFIDSDGNGQMDDLDHDGKITTRDSRVIEAAVDRVEKAHPELIGGTGVYPAAPGHGPFIHIDTRGYRARWTES